MIEWNSRENLKRYLSEKGAIKKVEKLSRDEIYFEAGVVSMIYIDFDDMKEWCKEEKKDFENGVFIRSRSWLNQNQINFVRSFFQDKEKKTKDLNNLVLDKVS